ncbi:MAG TPA: hypothetical protein VME21_06205 [Steroidobacteraceae bacterium]|nr:hypothetical protein [Steroidobacteraceae bacterium]
MPALLRRISRPGVRAVTCALAALLLCFLAAIGTAQATTAESALSGSAAAAPSAPGADPLFEQPPAGTPNFTGKWLMQGPITHLLTTDGREPPLNAAGRAEYARRQAALQRGDRSVDPLSHCLMHGVPRLLYAPYPFLILQTTRSIAFVHEANHTFRIIYWDKMLPEDPDPDWLGYSIARFEGRTLVIDTIGFNDKTWLDYSGLPHGEKLRVQERFTLKDASTIEGTVTLSDPDFYRWPWSTRFVLKKQDGMQLRENVCTDTHQM